MSQLLSGVPLKQENGRRANDEAECIKNFSGNFGEAFRMFFFRTGSLSKKNAPSISTHVLPHCGIARNAHAGLLAKKGGGPETQEDIIIVSSRPLTNMIFKHNFKSLAEEASKGKNWTILNVYTICVPDAPRKAAINKS
ncbi:hypothetical protein CEXT_640251 [Caerostris extrusa]|uniref:Uncharacterized protein n=1 Tax=Caerostris extrusa TaxID=172846 RepID=A0AAV4QNA1_CAEEX|nr:hypothetical protein CEXT_640251 [Caerostris extrusa]